MAPNRQVKLTLPPDQRGGVYADAAAVWHNEHGFTIDFIAPDSPARKDDGDDIVVDATVVARVRLPTSVMFQVARAISENVSNYEAQFGKIPAGGPDHPPEEQA